MLRSNREPAIGGGMVASEVWGRNVRSAQENSPAADRPKRATGPARGQPHDSKPPTRIPPKKPHGLYGKAPRRAGLSLCFVGEARRGFSDIASEAERKSFDTSGVAGVGARHERNPRASFAALWPAPATLSLAAPNNPRTTGRKQDLRQRLAAMLWTSKRRTRQTAKSTIVSADPNGVQTKKPRVSTTAQP